jgi:hypothetical protein
VRAGLRIVLLTQELRQKLGELELSNADLESARVELERRARPPARCSSCGKLRGQDGEWVEPERFFDRDAAGATVEEACTACRSARTAPKPRAA